MENKSEEKLPNGVHRLSEESQEILRRAKERGEKIAEKHLKRAS